MYRGPRLNDFPVHIDPPDSDVIREDVRRARHFGDLSQPYGRRILGEVAARYRLPQHIEDLQAEVERLQNVARDSAANAAHTETPYRMGTQKMPRK